MAIYSTQLQQSYSQYHRAGRAGDIYGDITKCRSLTVRNNSSSDLPYGIMVAGDAGGTNGSSRAVRLISSASDFLMGVVARWGLHAPNIHSIANNALSGDNGIPANFNASVIVQGPILVPIEEQVNVGDPVYVRWGAGNGSSTAAAWAAATAYYVGQRVTANFGKVYQCITAGTSAASGVGPTGTSTDITDGTAHWKYIGLGTVTDSPGVFRATADLVTAWAIDTAYTKYTRVSNDSGKVYECITAGTSAHSGGPTGTTADITDNTAHWKYVGTCDASTTASCILLSNARWIGSSAEFNDFDTCSGVAPLLLNLP